MPDPKQESTAIEKSAVSKMTAFLKNRAPEIRDILGQAVDLKRFSWLAVNSFRQNPALLKCTPESFINSVMLATQMRIEIRRDSAYLVPFGSECQLLVDYKAKLAMARRSGKVGGIQAVPVRELDEFDYHVDERGFHLMHRTRRDGRTLTPEERGPLVAVYAFAQLSDGGMQWREPMSMMEIDRIRKRSRAGVRDMTISQIMAANELGENGLPLWDAWAYKDARRKPWVTDFEAMCLKTVLHSLYKSIPLDETAQRSQEVDDGFDMGKQPSVLGEGGIDIPPEMGEPMMAEDEAEKLREQTADEAIKKAGADPLTVSPHASTISTIKGLKKKLGEKRWLQILGDNGITDVAEIRTEGEARKIKIVMQDAEAETP